MVVTLMVVVVVQVFVFVLSAAAAVVVVIGGTTINNMWPPGAVDREFVYTDLGCLSSPPSPTQSPQESAAKGGQDRSSILKGN